MVAPDGTGDAAAAAVVILLSGCCYEILGHINPDSNPFCQVIKLSDLAKYVPFDLQMS